MKGKTVLLFVLCLAVTTSLSGQHAINAGTFNVRYDNTSDRKAGNGWDRRCRKICDMVAFHEFDIFGAQEVLYGQAEDIAASLPGFAYIGVGRDDGALAGEFTPIFFDEEKFILVDSGNFWLSKTPDKPSLGWDAACRRVCTWGKFRVRGTRKVFWFFNTHFDHVGKKARRESARLVVGKIEEIVPEKGTVILTGDFNVGENDEVIALLEGSSMLQDSFEASEIKMAWVGTFNGFDLSQPSRERIDHIFVSPRVNVIRYGVLTETYQENEADPSGKPVVRYPSDHFPILTTLEF